ncbi:zinc-dependent alcohol dehydrogenase [Nocardioides nitrophenolicus]|uniref:zinc-dependent alcohol dehydrogenase n=1 Tax=Nocardioides nitrophenolicus TaxID=60489 RepID=UPI00195EB9EC|nr:alcohol dehydrogenase catalytic domain-containing protein [Nocardioides nitrophenolicus]MBM7517383.1 alcohol dehydrogenase [Nocardioides nitrophenolicus]
MKALVFTGPGVVELQDVPEPVAAAGEVEIRVVASGICGSELHGIAHTEFRKPPLVMGHEFSGTTPDGRRVTVNPLLSCGGCAACVRGDEQLCETRAIIGIDAPGAFAERVVVPERAVRELPDDLSFAEAALVEPLANAVHAVRLADLGPDSRVAILGAGTIGLTCLLVALQHTADVTVTDLAPGRLELAASLGAARTSSTLEGRYDAIIDAVGAEATHQASVDFLRPGGTAVWIGLLSASAGFDGQEIVRAEKRVVGSYCYTPRDFDQALDLATRVRLDWATTFPLTEGAEVFTSLMAGVTETTKALLMP